MNGLKKYNQSTSTFIVLAVTIQNDCAPKARQSKQLWNELRWICVKLLRVLRVAWEWLYTHRRLISVCKNAISDTTLSKVLPRWHMREVGAGEGEECRLGSRLKERSQRSLSDLLTGQRSKPQLGFQLENSSKVYLPKVQAQICTDMLKCIVNEWKQNFTL